MDFSRLRAWARGHRTPLTLASAFLLFIGVELILFTPKGLDLEWFGLPFLAAGGSSSPPSICRGGSSPRPRRALLNLRRNFCTDSPGAGG